MGPYRLARVLGRGSAATVHLAQDQRGTDLWVALKVLDSHGDQDEDERSETRDRFLQEAQLAQRLRHADIVALLDCGESQGQLWMAMELALGCSMQRYTVAGRLLPPELSLQLAARVARALEHAHRQGIVHRDIKPANVLVHLAGNQVKLTDFGTARMMDNSRTRTGVMLGTPAYMAPEQLAGAPADALGDVYALGVLLFELLTGRRPHEAASLGELLRQVASQAAPDLRQLWPQAPPDLAQALALALQRLPANRPSSAGALADLLERARMHGSP